MRPTLFPVGSKPLAWLGIMVTIAGLIAEHADLVPSGFATGAEHVAQIGGLLLTALGGSVARPQNQRAADRGHPDRRADDPPSEDTP